MSNMTDMEAIALGASVVSFFAMWMVFSVCDVRKAEIEEHAETERLRLQNEHEQEMARLIGNEGTKNEQN
jgi:hypothetical protein